MEERVGKAVYIKKKEVQVIPNTAIYSIDEFVAGADTMFALPKECVYVALTVAGVQSCTVDEATKIVKDFCKKEV